MIGRHDDGIVGLGFQQAVPFAGRGTCDETGLTETTATPDDVATTAAGIKLDDDSALVASEEAYGSRGTPAAKPSRQGGVNRPGGRRSGGRGAAGAARGLGGEQEAAAEEDEEGGEEGGEGEAGFESVVLSASMDGVVRAWEMLGKSEKYRMRHPAGVEVTSMLVLPGGSVLVTGEEKNRALACLRLVLHLRGCCSTWVSFIVTNQYAAPCPLRTPLRTPPPKKAPK